ncbi:MAG: hypothetical protein R6V85_16890 [Polyangia bacterium]
MSFECRIVLIALWPAAALAVDLAAPDPGAAASEGVRSSLESAGGWLWIIVALFGANWLLAWTFRRSWPMTLARSLVWALIAFLCISEIVDLFGENREIAWQIVGLEDGGDPRLLSGLRWLAAHWAVALGAAATCIAVGFEPRAEKTQ